MEHTLLTAREMVLSREGIPYHLICHLMEGSYERGHTYCDGNLASGRYFGSDEDLDEINGLEKSLGKLTPDKMDLRVMADFCCIWRYDYPQRLYDMCAAIGGNQHTAFGLHYQISSKRRQELIDYAEALKLWLSDGAQNEKPYSSHGFQSIVNKVFQYLGKKDPLKKLLVERTYYGLSSRALNCSFWGYNAQQTEVSLHPYTAQDLPGNWHERMSVLEKAISKEMGHQAHDFLCDVGGSAEPACHFKFVRRVDILVSSIGCLRWRGNLPAKDTSISGRRAITALYLDVLEKYWRGNSAAQNSRAGKEQEKAGKELFGLLGEETTFKRWLVASLWKNIKNQTQYHAFPMKRWVEFVRIGEDYLRGKASGK